MSTITNNLNVTKCFEDLPNPPMFSLQIPVRSRVSCNVAAQHAGEIRDSMLCAGLEMPAINTPAICQSTRGAGLFCSGRFVGVASFGYGCGESNIPGVYTQVIQRNCIN